MLQHLTAAIVLDIAAKDEARRAAMRQQPVKRLGLGLGYTPDTLPTPANLFATDALPAVKAANAAVDALSREQLQELAALVQFGGGAVTNWGDALRYAASTVNSSTPGYLLEKPDFARWLRAGLEKLGPTP